LILLTILPFHFNSRLPNRLTTCQSGHGTSEFLKLLKALRRETRCRELQSSSQLLKRALPLVETFFSASACAWIFNEDCFVSNRTSSALRTVEQRKQIAMLEMLSAKARGHALQTEKTRR
jgi:hypothetical protein